PVAEQARPASAAGPDPLHNRRSGGRLPSSADRSRDRRRTGRESGSSKTPAHPGVPSLEVLMTMSPNARLRTQRGVTSAEYAVVTAAGCGFATILIKL